MLSYFRWVLFFIALLVTVMGGALWLGNQLLGSAGPLEKTKNIVIPRGAQTTSGANFEILVGFDVTPQMAQFNRVGKRFRVNAGASAVAAAGNPAQRR